MNAKVKETGKWITVNPCNEGFYDVETHDIYEPDELDFVPEFDWQSFRREAAKDILAGFCASGNRVLADATTSLAIQLADELIRQLQEK